MYQKADKPVDVHNFVDKKVDMLKFRGSYFDRCVLWAMMDEMSGTKTKDWSFNGNNGTLYGPTWTAAGKFHHCLNFDGINDYVDLGSGPNLKWTREITIEGWGNIDTPEDPSDVYIMVCRNNTDVSLDVYRRTISGTIGGNFISSAAAVVQDTNWHHYAFTYSNLAKQAKLYYDGAVVATSNGVNWMAPNTGIYYIGHRNLAGAFWWDGKIDEVRIYKRILTPDEIKKRYEIGRRPPFS